MIILPAIKQRHDDSFKKTFCNREFLAILMKSCIPEYRNSAVNYIRDVCLDGTSSEDGDKWHIASDILGLNTEDIVPEAGRVYFDLLISARLPLHPEEKLGILLNIELQNDFSPGYPLTKRALYYASRMIVLQKGKCFAGSDYSRLRKVYSVWICPRAPEAYANSVVLYRVNEHRLAGKPPRHPVPEEDYDLLSMLMIHLNDKFPVPTASEDDAVLRLLEAVFSQRMSEEQRCIILRDEFAMTTTTQKEILDMKTYADCIYEEGRLEGRQEGRQEGRREGRQEGRQEGRLEGRQEGRREGRQEGRQEGQQDCILGMVRRFRAAKMAETTILDMMVKGLGTTEEEIRRYMALADK